MQPSNQTASNQQNRKFHKPKNPIEHNNQSKPVRHIWKSISSQWQLHILGERKRERCIYYIPWNEWDWLWSKPYQESSQKLRAQGAKRRRGWEYRWSKPQGTWTTLCSYSDPQVAQLSHTGSPFTNSRLWVLIRRPFGGKIWNLWWVLIGMSLSLCIGL